MNPQNRIVSQLLVLIPTVALSAFLGHIGVPTRPRLFYSLSFGMLLIAIVAYWRRQKQ